MIKAVVLSIFVLFVYSNLHNSIVETGIWIKANFIEIDNQGNVYAISENSISKYNNKLELLQTYSQNFYGKISSVDVSNSFKILVFFKDFSTIFLLDNNLSEINKIDLTFADYNDIQLISSSSQSGFWIYDNTDKRIYLINEKLETLHKTKSLKKYINENELIDLIEDNHKLFLGIKHKGILSFDNYGNFDRFIEFNLMSSFSVYSGKTLYFLDSINNITNKTEQQIQNVYAVKEESIEIQTIYKTTNALDFKTNGNQTFVLKIDSLIVSE